jgi:hypothetical protein
MSSLQMRLNDMVMNEQPELLSTHPTKQDYAIVLEDLTISLDICNVAACFHGLTPMQQE